MRRACVIGGGDLGRRLVAALAARGSFEEILIAGRQSGLPGPEQAFLLASCGDLRVRFIEVDALDTSSLERLIRTERPDLLLQCATLLSPWLIPRRTDERARALGAAGFAVQLAAQLPLVHSLMRAVREVGFAGPVVSCSYPDVVHPILARLGLAPTVGIGNVGMIAGCIEAQLRSAGRPFRRVRVLGHHAHVTAAMRADATRCAEPRPRVYLGDEGERADELAFSGIPLTLSPELNALTAAHGARVVEALLPGGGPLHTSAPGPLGLPGGYPVRISDGKVALDLPPGLSAADAEAHNRASARHDGVEHISDDGTVTFTEEVRDRVAQFEPRLAEPFRPGDALDRFSLLESVLRSHP